MAALPARQGAVVGISTAIVDPSGKGTFSGVGYAVPIDAVRGLVEQILTHGRPVRPALGITVAPAQVGCLVVLISFSLPHR